MIESLLMAPLTLEQTLFFAENGYLIVGDFNHTIVKSNSI